MNEFFKTLISLISIGFIIALFTWKPIDIAWSVYDKYEDIELSFYGLLLSFFAYLLIVSFAGGIAYGVATIIDKIHKKANK